MEDMVIKRQQIDNPPTISEIVSTGNDIKYSLNQLTSDVLYKTRVAAEEKLSVLNQEYKKQ